MSRERLAKLKEDFTYNLRLLEERDAELERYDAAFASLRAQEDDSFHIPELYTIVLEAEHAHAGAGALRARGFVACPPWCAA